ncbi:hypothetical protein ACOSQ3_004328 [Xanthoceras sorbifolium]
MYTNSTSQSRASQPILHCSTKINSSTVLRKLQSGPSITTTPATPKFNSSTVLRTLELSSIQTHMTRRGNRGGLITTEPLQHQIHAPSNTNAPDPSPPNNPSQLTREATSSSSSPPI